MKITQLLLYLFFLTVIVSPFSIEAESSDESQTTKNTSQQHSQLSLTPADNGTCVYNLEYIIIDAGHGGKDPGYVSSWDVYEKDIVLALAKRLAALANSKTNYTIHLTRETDERLTLQKRTEIANQFPADKSLFISIHCNSSSYPQVRGLETYIFDVKASDEMAARVAARENADEVINPIEFIVSSLRHRGNEKYNWEAAYQAQSTLVKRLKVRNRNTVSRDRKVMRAPFRVLAYTDMPAILIEIGFLSNQKEQKKLQSSKYQQQIAEALLEAIVTYDKITETWANGKVANAITEKKP